MVVPGDEIVTELPCVQAPALSRYWVAATPEPSSLAVKIRVTGWLTQPEDRPLTEVVGGVVSVVELIV